MKKSILKNIILCSFLSLPLLAGCGLKGELYQTPPEEKSPESTESVKSTGQEKQ